MKALTIMLLLCFIGNAQAQKVIQLSEARVNYSPEMKLTGNLDNLEIKVKEDYAGQFSQNPIKFMEDNFNIHDLIGSLDAKSYDQFDVKFKSNKGYLMASFDKNGELIRTSQKFRDIALPNELSQQLVRDFKGYSMVKNKYVASGKGNTITKQHYLITLKNGKDKQNVKLAPAIVAGGKVATNY